MLFKRVSKRTKAKPRGRPFSKNNNRGKSNDSLLDVEGRTGRIERETLMKKECESMKENNTVQDVAAFTPEISVVDTSKAEQKPIESITQEPVEVVEVIDSLDFKDEKGNTLKIIYRATPARRYRLQIFLNDTQEIRPVTYNGTSTSMSFWNMLKGNLKK